LLQRQLRFPKTQVYLSNKYQDSIQQNKTPNATYESELELLAETLKWAWMDKAQITWLPEAQSYLLEKATELFNKFHYDRIPLVSADMKWKLARLSVSMAYLTLSTDDFSQLIVTKDHVALVCETLEEEYSRSGLNALAQTEHMERLTPEDVERLLLKIQGQLTKEPIETETLIEILKFILLSGGTTQEQIKAKFELTEKNQLRPLMVTLQTEGLVKVNRGYYQTAKLVEAHKVTNGFASLACLAEVKKEHPPHETERTEQAADRHSFSEDGKDGTNGKPEKQEKQQPIFYVKELPSGEKCEACRALAVTKEILTPQFDKLRRCENCYLQIKRTFTNATFTSNFPDLPIDTGKGASL
jgi:hypothetical protein